MLTPGFILLERCRKEKNRLAVLDRSHAPHREAAAIARAIDLVDDRMLDVACLEEICMQRMRVARGFERRVRGRQCLAQHLPAEHVLGADVAALAAEQVVLEAFEREQVDQLGNGGGHDGLRLGCGGEL